MAAQNAAIFSAKVHKKFTYIEFKIFGKILGNTNEELKKCLATVILY